MKTETEVLDDLLDDDGENRAVRSFLMAYGVAGLTVGEMQRHMNRCGFPHWPAWVEQSGTNHQHLTKAGAQIWLRHLFALEPATRPESDAALLRQAAEALEALDLDLPPHAGDKVAEVAASLRAALEKKP